MGSKMSEGPVSASTGAEVPETGVVPPRVRSLEDWLAPPGSGSGSAPGPGSMRSRLREIAAARGAYLAAWAAGLAFGAELIVLGLVLSIIFGSAVPALAIGLPGAALLAGCCAGYARVSSRLPNTNRAISRRGPGDLRQGGFFVGFILLVFIAILAFTVPPASWLDPSHLSATVITLGFLIALLTAAILVPAAVLGRARESLRRKARRDPRFHALLEADLAAWDPNGNVPYGPL